MQLVAYQNINRKSGTDSFVLARTFIVLPTDVPMNCDLTFDEYRQEYLLGAKKRFDNHLRENNYKNFEIYGYAQSRMNNADFDDDNGFGL